jgi:3',5'-cyclic AMP phosphodiesterase CpdA
MRTIAQISDLHFGRHSSEIMEDLLKSLDQSHPDVVAMSGDFTQRAKHSEFAEARKFLDRICYPKVVVPGNHDVPLYNAFSRLFLPLAKYNHYVAPVGQADNFFLDEELAVLGINTARSLTVKNGRISHNQIASVSQMLKATPENVTKILVTHHPLGLPSGEARLELAGRSALALEVFEAAGVRILLSGHHHRARSGSIAEIEGRGSVLIVYAGTAISSRLRGGEGNTYNLMRIAPGHVSVDIMAWSAGRGFQMHHSKSYIFASLRWRPV